MGSRILLRKGARPWGLGEGKSTKPCSHGRSVQSPWVTNLSFRQLCSEAQAVISGPENSSKEVPESPSCGPAVLSPRNHLALVFVCLSLPGLFEWVVQNAFGDPVGQRSSSPSHCLPGLNSSGVGGIV